MPDPYMIMMSIATAAVSAAAAVLASAWIGRYERVNWMAADVVLGVAFGFCLGCWVLDVRPSWPPREDQDRLLLLVMPTVVFVELFAAFAGRWRIVTWALRTIVATGVGRVLLHDTIYITDLGGPGSREWDPAQTLLILGGLALLLTGVWFALAILVQRVPGRSVPLSFAMTIAAAAIAVMLSGYASGGQLGLPLAAAVGGAVLATFASLKPVPTQGPLGMGVVGLFALLMLGRFFGNLATDLALLLFSAPLVCWLPELPYLRRLSPSWRGAMRIMLTAIPLAVALYIAQQRFAQDTGPVTSQKTEPSIQDYLNFGR